MKPKLKCNANRNYTVFEDLDSHGISTDYYSIIAKSVNIQHIKYFNILNSVLKNSKMFCNQISRHPFLNTVLYNTHIYKGTSCEI